MRHDGRMTDAVRPPLQARTKESWHRVLEVGLELLEHGGFDALTVSEVCRRARISAPSLYARVDGRRGLFLAVYEHGMALVRETEQHELTAAHGSVDAVVGAVAAVFSRHSSLLRTVIARASDDAALLERGAARSRAVVERVADALPGDFPAERRLSTARMIYTECAFRAMYGDAFWHPDGQPEAAFVASLASGAHALLASEQPVTPGALPRSGAAARAGA